MWAEGFCSVPFYVLLLEKTKYKKKKKGMFGSRKDGFFTEMRKLLIIVLAQNDIIFKSKLHFTIFRNMISKKEM